jgi:hypothetical protein
VGFDHHTAHLRHRAHRNIVLMATRTTGARVDLTATVAAPTTFRGPPKRLKVFITSSTGTGTNLVLWYRMGGFDSGNTWRTWIVQDTPDPTGARYPGGGVTFSTDAQIMDRFFL